MVLGDELLRAVEQVLELRWRLFPISGLESTTDEYDKIGRLIEWLWLFKKIL